MTNAEKFKEVFGYELNRNLCMAPEELECIEENCDKCSWDRWWKSEFIPVKDAIEFDEERGFG